MCVVTEELCENLRLQISHEKGFSPECVRKWAVRLAACVNALLHLSHLYGFSPECVRMCVLSVLGRAYVLSHTRHRFARPSAAPWLTVLLLLPMPVPLPLPLPVVVEEGSEEEELEVDEADELLLLLVAPRLLAVLGRPFKSEVRQRSYTKEAMEMGVGVRKYKTFRKV